MHLSKISSSLVKCIHWFRVSESIVIYINFYPFVGRTEYRHVLKKDISLILTAFFYILNTIEMKQKTQFNNTQVDCVQLNYYRDTILS